MASYPFVLWFFPSKFSKVLRLPGRNWGESYEVLRLSRENHLSKPEGLMLQNVATLRKSAPWLRKSAPWPPNMSDSIMRLLYCACYAKSIFADLCRTSSNAPRLPSFSETAASPTSFLLHFWQGAEPGQRKNQKKEDLRVRTGKIANQWFVPMFCGSGGSKSRFAKVADAEPSGQMRYQKVQPLWHEAHFEVKMLQNTWRPGKFLAVEEVGKVQAAGVRSTNRKSKCENMFKHGSFGS